MRRTRPRALRGAARIEVAAEGGYAACLRTMMLTASFDPTLPLNAIAIRLAVTDWK